MKFSLLALCSILFLSACASMRVTRTEVATGAAHPKAIYIRPFSVKNAVFSDRNNPNGEAIRRSQAPIEFAEILQEELAKIAPAYVLKPGESAPTGWLVEGEFDVICSGQIPSRLVLHVRVTEIGDSGYAGEESDFKTGVSVYDGISTPRGRIIYAFDLAGGSRGTGVFGSVNAPGLGRALPFDFRNAAERIMLVLSPDPFRYGYRNTPIARQ